MGFGFEAEGSKSWFRTALKEHLEKTDGMPLFVEEVTKMALESGLLVAREGRYELTGSLDALAIPATLQDSLMARLDRLSAAKDVAQLGRWGASSPTCSSRPCRRWTRQHCGTGYHG